MVKNLPANTGDARDVSIPGWGRFPGEGNGNPLQYSCLEKSMDRGVWRATVHGVKKSWTRECKHGAFKESDKALHGAVPPRKWRNSRAVAPCTSREVGEEEQLLSLDLQNLLIQLLDSSFLFLVYFLKPLLNLLHYCFCFTFWFFDPKACGVLTLRTGNRTYTPRVGRLSLYNWTIREVPVLYCLI